MVFKPAAVIIVNNDLTTNVKDMLIKQLHITETITGNTFDNRINNDSTYVNKIKQLNQRLLVIRDLSETTNRNSADVVIFISHGLASILTNKFGPPGKNIRVVNLDWGDLAVYGPP